MYKIEESNLEEFLENTKDDLEDCPCEEFDGEGCVFTKLTLNGETLAIVAKCPDMGYINEDNYYISASINKRAKQHLRETLLGCREYLNGITDKPLVSLVEYGNRRLESFVEHLGFVKDEENVEIFDEDGKIYGIYVRK